MRRRPVVLLVFLLLALPTFVFAKADISKISIKGPDLKNPIEITDSSELTQFDLWSGPGTSWTGTSPRRNDKFLVDWSQPVTELPKALRRYEVSIFAKLPEERLVYVLLYEYDPATDRGYVYLPGRTDNWYRLNVSTIVRGVEGTWFRSSSAWDDVAGPLIRSARGPAS